MAGLGGVQNQPVQGLQNLQQAQTPDQQLQALQNKVANRGAFGKACAWLRNTLGLRPTNNDTMVNFRNAIQAKVGDAGAARAIFDHLNLGKKRALTDSQATAAIALSNKYEQAKNSPLYQQAGQNWFEGGFAGVLSAIKTSGVQVPNNITVDEMVGIHNWTTQEFHAFNSEIRSGNESPKTTTWKNAIVSGLNKLPDYVGQVQRGCSLPQNVDANYRPGQTVTSDGFYAASKSTDEAFPGVHQLSITVQAGSGGKDISGFSDKPWEQEILFPPGAQFDVLSRDGAVGAWHDNGIAQFGNVDLVLQTH